MQSHLSPLRSRAAFTLIELLSVVAIVGILAAIIFPTARAVRRSAQNAVCVSNLRQWGVALQLYSNDTRQRNIPYEGSDDMLQWSQVGGAADAQSWFNVLPPYVGMPPIKNLTGFGTGLTTSQKKTYFLDNKMIYGCGADERPALDNATVYITPSYMMNSQLYGKEGPAGTKDGPATAGGGRLLNMNDFNNVKYSLSRIAFMIDAGTENPSGTRGRIRGHGDAPPGVANEVFTGVDPRHNGSANVVFMDGSVRAIARADLNAPKSDPTSVVWLPW